MPIFLLASLALAAGADEVPLVSFAAAAPKELHHKWTTMNDPVMGGRSHSHLDTDNGVLNFTGVCAIVPSLKAPGFITAVTGNSWFHSETFADVSSCTGLKIVANDLSGGYKGYRVSFGTAKVGIGWMMPHPARSP